MTWFRRFVLRQPTDPTADAAVRGIAASASRLQSYSLGGVDFDPRRFTSTADCLTAASAQKLPLEVCP